MTRRATQPGLPRVVRSRGRDIPIPPPGELVAWDGNLRAEVPRYVLDQVRAEAFQSDCTQTAVILRALAQCRDDHGQLLFDIRQEELVADRRKEPSSTGDQRPVPRGRQ